MPVMNMVQALNSAMDVMLARDPDVLIFGEDVGFFGGVFRGSAAPVAAGWLALAATPTFAVMALLTYLSDADAMCSAAGASPLSGMVPMYLLMSGFHSAPWLKLFRAAMPGVRTHVIEV